MLLLDLVEEIPSGCKREYKDAELSNKKLFLSFTVLVLHPMWEFFSNLSFHSTIVGTNLVVILYESMHHFAEGGLLKL